MRIWHGEVLCRRPGTILSRLRYLVAHRDEIPGAMETAEQLNQWIADTFIERDHMFAPAAGVREQTVCFSIMGGHSIHWAAMMTDLYNVTGNQKQRWEVTQALNFVTYLIQPDNRIVIGAEHGLSHPQGAFQQASSKRGECKPLRSTVPRLTITAVG